MIISLDGACLCGSSFIKKIEVDPNSISNNVVTATCQSCHASLAIGMQWQGREIAQFSKDIQEVFDNDIQSDSKETIARQLHDKKVEGTKIDSSIQFDPSTLIHTFQDGSKAKIIQRREECKPYISASQSTMSHINVGYWKALDF